MTPATLSRDTRKHIVIRAHGRGGDVCYVRTGEGPRSIYAAHGRGRYPDVDTLTPDVHADISFAIGARGIRWGAYGDPAFLPLPVVERWTGWTGATRWTGYTHQWRTCNPGFSRWLMASCDTTGDVLTAEAAGWRGFRAAPSDEPDHHPNRLPSEIVCPAAEEAGSRTTCDRCGLCNGSGGSSRGFHPAPYRWSGDSNGVLLWRGPSPVDGAPIMCILTGLQSPSVNGKTGPMLQTWIMREDIPPHHAQRGGEDSSVCGGCPLRPLLARSR